MFSAMKSFSLSIFIYFFIFSICTAQESPFFNYDWKSAIDLTWGEGLPAEEKLKIFDSTWTLIDKRYACFNNLDINWDSLKNIYRPEIENGVSEGRFTAILNHMGIKLKEGHTSFVNLSINNECNPPLKKPLIYPALWGLDEHFGAGLSILPDSSLLVYAVDRNHPLGLKPGDVILGYEGIPWKRLYKILLEMEFPIGTLSPMGGNDISFTSNWLKGAGSNWHLFETIDIVKYDSHDTLHLPTSLMKNSVLSLHHSDQLPIPGVKFHKLYQEDEGQNYSMSWGIVDNTNIGYLYIWSWSKDNIQTRFYNALDSLINIYKVDGLILDMRANSGGFISASNEGLDLLFKKSPCIIGLASRTNETDHYSLVKLMDYNLPNDTATYFDKPIALLTGTLAFSAADFISYRLSGHPRVKIFGNSTSASFASAEDACFGDYRIRYASINGYSESYKDKYLTHSNPFKYEEVHFTPDDVRKEIDTIVKEALEWINAQNTLAGLNEANIIEGHSLSQNYPNPFNPLTNFEFRIGSRSGDGSDFGLVTLKIFDILGNEVTTLINEEKQPGEYKVSFDGSNLSSGVYFCRLQVNGFTQTRKMLLMK